MPKKVAVEKIIAYSPEKVTGSNKGIGFATVKALCSKFDGDVILTARDEFRGWTAVKNLEADNLYPKFHLLDITCAKSIKRLASFLKHEYGGLDILVNNAAIGYLPGDSTPMLEQATKTIDVNVFGTINVCKEMFPLLRQHARIVNLSSSTGQLSNISNDVLRAKFLAADTEEDIYVLMEEYIKDVKNGVYEENGWGSISYQISKIAITALTFIQHRRFMEHPEQDIIVNAVHPGRTRTDLVKNDGPLTPDQGAIVPVYCALLPPNITIPRGQFVWCDKSIKNWI